MKTKNYVLSLLLLIPTLKNSQVVLKTTIASGSFTNPAIWSPPGAPNLTITAYNLIINHSVTSTGLLHPQDSVIINSSGSLTGQKIITKKIINKGALNFSHCIADRLRNSTTANLDTLIVKSFTNLTGALINSNRSVSDSLLNLGNIKSNEYFGVVYSENHSAINTTLTGSFSGSTKNYGSIGHVGTAIYSDLLQNFNTGKICAGVLSTFNDSIVNNGSISGARLFFTGAGFNSSSGIIFSTDTSMIGDFINNGKIHSNKLIMILGNYYTNNGTLSTVDLTNASVNFNGTGGKTCYSGTIINGGFINGSMDVCDLSPNSGDMYGLIGPSVTQCAVSPCSPVINPCMLITSLNANIKNNFKLSLYPNPTNGNLNISSENEINEVTIYTLDGKLLLNQPINSTNAHIQTSDLPNGMYFASINIDGTLTKIKFIKN